MDGPGGGRSELMAVLYGGREGGDGTGVVRHAAGGGGV